MAAEPAVLTNSLAKGALMAVGFRVPPMQRPAGFASNGCAAISLPDCRSRRSDCPVPQPIPLSQGSHRKRGSTQA